jgi:hypothetical protein
MQMILDLSVPKLKLINYVWVGLLPIMWLCFPQIERALDPERATSILGLICATAILFSLIATRKMGFRWLTVAVLWGATLIWFYKGQVG